MSVATKLGLAYSSCYGDAYRSRRGVLLGEQYVQEEHLSEKRTETPQPSSWLNELLLHYAVKSIRSIATQRCAEEEQKVSDAGDAEITCDATSNHQNKETGGSKSSLASREPAAAPFEVNQVTPSVSPTADAGASSAAVPAPSMVSGNGIESTITNEVPAVLRAENVLPEEDDRIGDSLVHHRKNSLVAEETPVSKHVDASTDAIGNAQSGAAARADAECELRGMIPMTCLSGVVDCIMRNIQAHNVHAVAIDDINQQLTEGISSPGSSPAALPQRVATAPSQGSTIPPVQPPFNSLESDDSAKRELAVYLYGLRDKVQQLQSQLDAREVVIERKLRQNRKRESPASRKITVEIVKAYDEDPVPYKKPPYRPPQERSVKENSENNRTSVSARSPSAVSPSHRDTTRASSKLSSDIVTEISFDAERERPTPRGRSLSSSSLSSLVVSASKKWTKKEPSSSSSLSSATVSKKSSGFRSETISSKSSSSSSKSRISIDEQVAKEFWARRAKAQQKAASTPSSRSSDAPSTRSSSSSR